jgi:hypothetical protein
MAVITFKVKKGEMFGGKGAAVFRPYPRTQLTSEVGVRTGFKSIQKMSWREFFPIRGQFHCLTYAEEGFAPLNIYTKDSGISREQLKEFAKQVNVRDEIGSLVPIASVTAVPRSCVRDPLGYLELRRHVESFFKENEKSIYAKCLVMYFGAPKVSDAVCQVIEIMDHDGSFKWFEKVVFIENV